MALYPSIVFHFTRKFGSLKKILTEGFKPSYAKETIRRSGRNDNEFAVPMVSFCDLRVSELEKHMDNYGHYGIGLRKSWATEKGLHPVFYINEKNRLIPDYLDGLETHSFRTNLSTNMDDYEEYKKFFRLQSFLKHYQGKLMRKGKLIQNNYLFADEREWRYVPEFPDSLYQLSHLSSKIIEGDWKEKYNKMIPSKFKLGYDPDDVRYLIVEDDDDVKKLIKFIRDKKMLMFGYHPDEMALLSSRILTYEQIENDI